MLDTWPMHGQFPPPPSASFVTLVLMPRSHYSISSFRSTPMSQCTGGLDPLVSQRRLSLQDLKSRGTELCPGSDESPRLGGTELRDKQCAPLPGLEACLGRFGSQPFPALKLPPWASGSSLAMAEAHAGISRGTERCLSPAAWAGERPWKAVAGPP